METSDHLYHKILRKFAYSAYFMRSYMKYIATLYSLFQQLFTYKYISILTSCLQQMQLVLTTLLQLVVWMHKQVTKQLHLMNLCSGIAKEM